MTGAPQTRSLSRLALEPATSLARVLWGVLGHVPGIPAPPASHDGTPAVPRYVQYGSLMTPPAPFRSLNTTLDGFWAQADEDRLHNLCRTVFADPSGGAVECTPISSRVMLTWGLIEQVVSETPPYDRMGGVQEPQVSVWIPVVVRGPGVREHFAMFIPYIWLDNAMSLATGRELFGYPKAWGWPRFADEKSRRWGLDVFGLDYDSGQDAGRHPLLEVVEGESPGESVDEDLSGLADVARHMADELFEVGDEGHVLPGFELGVSLAGDILDEAFPGVFLKQFRSVEDGLGAALQQIVETRYEVTRLRARPLLREHVLTVHALDSHPVGRELGLRNQTLALGYHVEMDFLVGEGRVLWDAAGRSVVR